MGAVYRCHQADLPEIKAAVKVMLMEAPEGSDSRFAREAAVLARLDHPAIVRFRQINLSHSPPYLVMDLVDGDSLAQRIGDGAVGVEEVLSIGMALSDALQHVHDQGIFHRDVKPANVIVGQGGRTKLVDFGIALDEGGPALTRTGMVPGSAPYVAPEIFHADHIDPRRWDVYGLGVTLYEALIGGQAFDGGSGSMERQLARIVMAKHAHAPLDPGETFPGALRELIQDMTTSDPEDRISAMSEVTRRIRRIQRAMETSTATMANPTLAPPDTGDLEKAPPPAPEQPQAAVSDETILMETPSEPANKPATWMRQVVVGAAVLLLVVGAWYMGTQNSGLGTVHDDPEVMVPRRRSVEVEVHGLPNGLVPRVRLGGRAPESWEGRHAQFTDVPLGTARLAVAAGAPCQEEGCPEQYCSEGCLNTSREVTITTGTAPLRIEVELEMPPPPMVSQRMFAGWIALAPEWGKSATGTERAGRNYLKTWHHDQPRDHDGDHPVVWVSGHAAEAFCVDRGGLLASDDAPVKWVEVNGKTTHWEWRTDHGKLVALHSNGNAHAPHGGDTVAVANGGFRCAWPWPSDRPAVQAEGSGGHDEGGAVDEGGAIDEGAAVDEGGHHGH
jgi:hypothetical protein